MNKAVMIALLFCLTSLTGCLGGDDLPQLEEIKEDEQIEPVGVNDLTNISADLDSLEDEINNFLKDFEVLQNDVEELHMSQNSSSTDIMEMNAKLSNLDKDLNHINGEMSKMSRHLDNFTGDVHNNFDNLSADINELHDHLDEVTSHMEQMQNEMDNLTIMHLMDENQRHVFNKMMLIAHLKENDAVNMNLSEADLSGADLSGVDFGGADLSHANLDGARFVGNNFSHAKLDNSHANGAYFRLVNFEEASVQNAHWNAVEIVDSNLGHAKFIGTEMHNCIIYDTSLVGSSFDRVKANDCYFYLVDGEESSWKGASLDHSTFEVSTFNNADFSKITDGPSTRMVGVTYASVSFIEATFAYADMSHSTMEVSSKLPSGFLNVMSAGGLYFQNCYDNNDDGDNYDCYSYGNYEDRLDYSRDQELIENYDGWTYSNNRYINCVDFMSADLNNTKLDNSKICVTQLPEGYYRSMGSSSDYEETYTAELFPVNARFVDTQFRRADMTNVHFGGSMSDWPSGDTPAGGSSGGQYNLTSGCYRIELSCMDLSGAALTLADLSDSHFDYADLSGADFSGSSAAGISWGHAMWNETNWTDSSEINGRGDPNEWESNDD
jgi:uncharacterized protein YjbI with pentapeptide repeats